MVRFALDEDFPETIIEALGLGIPEAELVLSQAELRRNPLDDIDLGR